MLLRHLIEGDRDEAGQPRLGRQEVVVAAVERPGFEVEADVEQVAVAVVEERQVESIDHRPCTGRQPLQFGVQVEGAGRRAGGVPLGGLELSFDHPRVEAQGGQGVQVEGVALGEVREKGGQAVSDAGRTMGVRTDGRLEAGLELLKVRQQRLGLGASGSGDTLGEEGDGVRETLPGERPPGVARAGLLAPLGEDDQAGGQVAAVHGRDVRRVQRLQRGGVEPVRDVASVPFDPVERVEGQPEPRDEGSRAQVAAVVRGEAGQ